MPNYKYIVSVDCDSKAEADVVMSERLGPEDDHGFSYRLRWALAPKPMEYCAWCGYAHSPDAECRA